MAAGGVAPGSRVTGPRSRAPSGRGGHLANPFANPLERIGRIWEDQADGRTLSDLRKCTERFVAISPLSPSQGGDTGSNPVGTAREKRRSEAVSDLPAGPAGARHPIQIP